MVTTGGDVVVKKIMSTSIEEGLLRDFKVECAKNSTKMNDVMEVFMRAYVRDSDFVYHILVAENPKNRFKMIEQLYEESRIVVDEIRETRRELAAKIDNLKKENPN
jgi:hypothetical protein